MVYIFYGTYIRTCKMDNLFMCFSVCLHATPSPRVCLITFLSIRIQLEMLSVNRDQSVNRRTAPPVQ